MTNFPILVAIETDATRYHGEHARRPALLDRSAAEQLLAHLSSDLAALFPDIGRYSLVMPGALFDQTQLLRPGYPVFAALESMRPDAGDNAPYTAQLLSIGAAQDRMPVPELQPLEGITPGILQVLPILVSDTTGGSTTLFDQMEHRFIEEGQVSAHSAKGLEAGFGININHARFMTLTDLNAMLHMQLDHFGFLGLWQLLDAALNDQPEALEATGKHGPRFRWDGERVLCRFETFDYWAQQGSGSSVPGDGQSLAESYGLWTREYRQYLVSLEAHAVPMAQYLPEQQDQPLEGTYLVEESAGSPYKNSARVTEHSSGDLGTIAVTVVDGQRLLNFYPTRAEGLNDLHAHIRTAGLVTDGVSFPGAICFERDGRRLEPDQL